jgi:hypothetical protein
MAACGPTLTVPSQQPVRTTSPSESTPPATPGPTPIASASPSAEPPAPIPGTVLDAPGAIVIANIQQRSATAWVLKLDVVQPDGSMVSGAVDFGVPAGWEPRTQLGRVRLTADGWAAIDINTIDDLAYPNDAVAIINVLGEGRATGPIIGTTPIWLPDGTLLISYDGEEVIRRIADHGFGDVSDLLDEQTAPTPVWRFGWVVEGDLSGIIASEAEYGEPPYITLRWDGGSEPRPPARTPYLAMGSERLASAAGARTVAREACHFEDLCRISWRRPNGRLLPIPGLPVDLAWTRDGTALAMLDFEGSTVVLVREDDGELVVTPLDAPLAPDAFKAISWIGGMSDWAAVIENDADETLIVPLDGSPAIGPFSGWLALVNP